MVKIVIKADFLNSMLEFSPNVRVKLKPGGDPDKPLFILDITPTTGEKFQSYSLSKNDIEEDEPYDDDDRFWKGLIDLAEKPAATPAPTPTPTPAHVVPVPTPAPVAPAPTPAPVALALTAMPAAPAAASNPLLKQFNSIKKLLANLEIQFNAQKIPQDQYLQKRNFLGTKMGELMGKLDAAGVAYEF